MPGPAGVARADIIALLHDGHSNNEIGRRLHTNPLRVATIRQELGLPNYKQQPALTLEQRWAVHAKPVTGGHVQWTGGIRCNTANLVYRQRNYSARRVAFAIEHGREPVGRVLPGCGFGWCVAPACATDEPMRRADTAFRAIFGRAA
ncbi:hypothetical protein ACFZCU_45920 [Streptomyces canus]|uniref:hypothetical protein n=1 Tax=Streptomyces canus TaxID=58343 RepID=UPI0036E30FA7